MDETEVFEKWFDEQYAPDYTSYPMLARDAAKRAWQARAALDTSAPIALTEERIDEIADFVIRSLPDGIRGFCRTWGYQQFAKALLDDCAGHYRQQEKL